MEIKLAVGHGQPRQGKDFGHFRAPAESGQPFFCYSAVFLCFR